MNNAENSNPIKTICCVTPVYNDWESFAILMDNIKKLQESASEYRFRVIAVDDCSTDDDYPPVEAFALPLTVLYLKVNI